MAFTKPRNNGGDAEPSNKSNGGYSAPDMVERHYVPFRDGNLFSCERIEIQSLAAAYRLGEEGLKELADYMNSVARMVHCVPTNAEKVARKFATIELPKPAKNREPYTIDHPEFDATRVGSF